MTENEFKRRLEALRAKIDDLPADQQARLHELADETERRDRETRTHIAAIEESLVELWRRLEVIARSRTSTEG